MDIFFPDIYAKNIYKIDYQKLKDNGIKCLIFDLDNTLVPISSTKPTKEIKELFAYLDDLDFKVIIMSNSGKKRVEPFKEILNVDSSCSSMKPCKKKYKKIKKIYNFKDDEIACIGDQLLTDVLGANRMHFTSIFVDSITSDDFIWTKPNRLIEKKIINYFNKKNNFKKGEYYD